jgi:hypothetical protein
LGTVVDIVVRLRVASAVLPADWTERLVRLVDQGDVSLMSEIVGTAASK